MLDDMKDGFESWVNGISLFEKSPGGCMAFYEDHKGLYLQESIEHVENSKSREDLYENVNDLYYEVVRSSVLENDGYENIPFDELKIQVIQNLKEIEDIEYDWSR